MQRSICDGPQVTKQIPILHEKLTAAIQAAVSLAQSKLAQHKTAVDQAVSNAQEVSKVAR